MIIPNLWKMIQLLFLLSFLSGKLEPLFWKDSFCEYNNKQTWEVTSSAFAFSFFYIVFGISLCFLSDISVRSEGAWSSTGGLYTICPAAHCRLWLALEPVPRIKVIQPVLCSINKHCPSSGSPKGYRNDLVETCWLSCVCDLANGSLVGLLLQHLAHLTRLQYISDTCECGDLTLPGTGCVQILSHFRHAITQEHCETEFRAGHETHISLSPL